MIRRLFKTGNSIVLSLPREVLEDLGVSDGQPISIELDRIQHRVILTPANQPMAVAGVDPAFASHLDEFINQYRLALEELAR
jgi:antitoxin MazE